MSFSSVISMHVLVFASLEGNWGAKRAMRAVTRTAWRVDCLLWCPTRVAARTFVSGPADIQRGRASAGHKHCGACSKHIPVHNWSEHVSSTAHEHMAFRKSLIDAGVATIRSPEGRETRPKHVWCPVCSIEVAAHPTTWETHIDSYRHKTAVAERKRKLDLAGIEKKPAIRPKLKVDF